MTGSCIVSFNPESTIHCKSNYVCSCYKEEPNASAFNSSPVDGSMYSFLNLVCSPVDNVIFYYTLQDQPLELRQGGTV